MAMLTVENLEASYGAVKALHRISLEVAEGELVALLGVNGAGKSTTLKSITGVLRPVKGTVTFNGEVITNKTPRGSCAGACRSCLKAGTSSATSRWRRICASVRSPRTGARHTGRTSRRSSSSSRSSRSGYAQHGGLLSGGEQQMLAIARALMARPKLLMLDEPSLGLSPAMTDTIFKLIAALRERGSTILLVEQNAERALEIVDRAYLLANGEVEFAGTAEELRRKVDIASVYFGDEDADTCEVQS